MKKTFNRGITLAVLFVSFALALTSCQDNAGEEADTGEFTTNWQARNTAYFDSVITVAKAEVAKAKAEYGNDWEANCDWRVYRSYAKSDDAGTLHDSVCVRIIERGKGIATPLYTDSVKVNYMGHLIPTVNYPKGKVFDHSGLYENESYVFSPEASIPTKMALSNTVEGYTTAVMRMHIGDRWMVYIPQELGYSDVSSGALPAYSTLCFDLQLKAFVRKAESFD